MGAYVGDIPKEYNIRAVCLYGLDIRSGADYRDRLDLDARLVGVSEKSAEGTLTEKPKAYSKEQISSATRILGRRLNVSGSDLEKQLLEILEK